MGKRTQLQEKLNDGTVLVIPEEELPSCCNSCYGYNCWWEPPSSEAGPSCGNECLSMDFCRTSNIHGLKYIGLVQGHFVERVVWSIIFLAAVVASVYLIRESVAKYIYSPVTVTFTEKAIHIDDIPFPAVTICNVNNLLLSKVDELFLNADLGEARGLSDEEIQESINNISYVEHVCDATLNSFSSKFDVFRSWNKKVDDWNRKFKDMLTPEPKFDVVPFLQTYAQKCSDMIKLCLWQGEQLATCHDLFHEVITDYGKCCVFNMAPESLLVKDPRTSIHRVDIAKQWKEGDFDTDSLIVAEHAEQTHHDKYQRALPEYPKRAKGSGLSNGISIIVDPDLDNYFCAAADSVGFRLSVHLPIEFPQVAEYGDAIPHRTESYIKVRPDVTKADDDMRDLPLEVRNCYFSGEYQLAYFKKYTRQNCFDECYANITYYNCNCTRFYMPRDTERALCTHEQINCTMGFRHYFQENPDTLDKYCGMCRITCNYLSYSAEVTSKPIRDDINIWVHEQGLHTRHWKGKNLSIIHVYFAEDTTYPKVRKRLLGITDLLASIGSLLGMTIGFSALSLFEFVYFGFKKVIGCMLRGLRVRECCHEDFWCCCCGKADSQDEDDEQEVVHTRRRKSFGRRRSQALPLRRVTPAHVQN